MQLPYKGSMYHIMICKYQSFLPWNRVLRQALLSQSISSAIPCPSGIGERISFSQLVEFYLDNARHLYTSVHNSVPFSTHGPIYVLPKEPRFDFAMANLWIRPYIRLYAGFPPADLKTRHQWHERASTIFLFTMETVKRDLWHKNLSILPVLPAGFIESFVEQQKTVAVTSERGYKFFLEGFVHDFEGKKW